VPEDVLAAFVLHPTSVSATMSEMLAAISMIGRFLIFMRLVPSA
jgi:hypothetical protein